MGAAPGPARPIQELNPAQTKRLNDILRGAKFTVTHRKTERVFSIIKLTSQPADNIKFTLNGKDGQPDRTVSVAQYFQEQYNVRVTRPRLPCVQYGKNFIPMEFVKLEPFNSIPMMRSPLTKPLRLSRTLLSLLLCDRVLVSVIFFVKSILN